MGTGRRKADMVASSEHVSNHLAEVICVAKSCILTGGGVIDKFDMRGSVPPSLQKYQRRSIIRK